MPTLSELVSWASSAIRNRVDELDAAGAGFLALWLALTAIAAVAVLAYTAVSQGFRPSSPSDDGP